MCQANSWLLAYYAVSETSSKELEAIQINMDLLEATVENVRAFISLASNLRRGGRGGIDRDTLDEFFHQAPHRLTHSLSCLIVPLVPHPTSDRDLTPRAPLDPRTENLLFRKETVCFLTEHAIHILSSTSKGHGIKVAHLEPFNFKEQMSEKEFASQAYQIISLMTCLISSPRLHNGWSSASLGTVVHRIEVRLKHSKLVN